MRVLFVTSSYPFHREDFHALFVHDMARAFVDRGDEVRVVTPLTSASLVVARETWDGVDVRRFDYPGLARFAVTGGEGLLENLKRRPLRAPILAPLFGALVAAVAREARAFRPDLIVAHWLVPGALAVALVPHARPAIFLAHGSDVPLLERVPGHRAIGALLARAGTIVATSSFLAQRMQACGLARDAPVVGLGVRAVAAAAAAPRAAATSDGPLRVCSMGRFVAGKGFVELVDAVARAPSTTLSIAGAGPAEGAIRAAIERHGIASRARIVAPVLDDAKAAFLAAHDLFAFVPTPPRGGQRRAAFQDNVPVVVLEALAAGLPVVATGIGGLVELLSAGGGAIVDGTTDAVSATLRELRLDRPRLERWSAEARRIGAARSSAASVTQLLRIAS